MSATIAPCPSCNCADEELRIGRDESVILGKSVFRIFVECSCGVRGPDAETKDEAVEKWNAMPRGRPQIDDGIVGAIVLRVLDKTTFRLTQKGRGAFVGTHETYGIIAEEVDELLEALRKDDIEQFDKELLDVAVACVIGMASILV